MVNGASTGVVPVQDGIGLYRQQCCAGVSDSTATIRIKPVSGSVIVDTVYFE
jgi:hypothetical protein